MDLQPLSAQARPSPPAITVLDSSTEDEAVEPPPACPTCLEPILPNGPPRRTQVRWPGCEHPYHLSCLARVRARLHPPNCALCRQPWPEREDASLSHACNQLGINPFQDSEVETAPPPASAPAGERPAMAPDHAEDGSWRRRGPPSNPINSPYSTQLLVTCQTPLLPTGTQQPPGGRLPANDWQRPHPSQPHNCIRPSWTPHLQEPLH